MQWWPPDGDALGEAQIILQEGVSIAATNIDESTDRLTHSHRLRCDADGVYAVGKTRGPTPGGGFRVDHISVVGSTGLVMAAQRGLTVERILQLAGSHNAHK